MGRIVCGTALLWLGSGCASRMPFSLRVVTPKVTVAPGGEARVQAELTNRGRKPLRFTTDAKLRTMLTCRRAIDPPGGGGLVTGNALEGGVWGGITDVQPDPDDPLFCRSHPPATIEVEPGGVLRLEAQIEAPSSCVEAPAELDVFFGAPDFSRRCPGIWYGEAKPAKPPAFIRHRAAGAQVVPSDTPKILECSLVTADPDRPSLRLALRNPTTRTWRARVIPSLNLVPAADPDADYWAPLSDGGDVVELGPSEEWTRTVSLDDRRWTAAYSLTADASLADLPRGRYTASLWLEVVGGRSWELRCSTATVELAAR